MIGCCRSFDNLGNQSALFQRLGSSHATMKFINEIALFDVL